MNLQPHLTSPNCIAGNVSRAAHSLCLPHPLASQSPTRLRLPLKDPLCARVANGSVPTLRAHAWRMAHGLPSAITTLRAALSEDEKFDRRSSCALMRQLPRRQSVPRPIALRAHADAAVPQRFRQSAFLSAVHGRTQYPGAYTRVTRIQLELHHVPQALDSGALGFPISFLPSASDTQRLALVACHTSSWRAMSTCRCVSSPCRCNRAAATRPTR